MTLNDVLEIEPLSKALQRTLRLAHEHGAGELATWLKLELGGYYDTNSAMNSSITVPKYRTVVGTHFNVYGQLLQVQPELSFVNEMRLREGVEALESIRDTRQIVVLQDPTMIGLIARYMHVEVATFQFDRVELVQVLSHIRSELFSRGQVLAGAALKRNTLKEADSEEILILKPTIHGVGIDLRALWKKATRGKKRK